MIRLAAAAVFALFVWLLAVPTSAAESEPDTYQWTDDRGNVGFTDSLEKVPPKFRKSAKKFKPGSPQKVPTPPATGGSTPGGSQETVNEVWQDRMNRARAELQDLKDQRQAAQEEYDALLRRRNMQSRPLEADAEPKASSKINDLDQRIRDKDHELTVTIPNEARQSGVPPSALDR
jgi:hypothetical protein